MFSIYKNVTALSAPFLKRYLQKRLQHGKEDPLRGAERQGIAHRPRPDGLLMWCHAASVGEAVSLLPVVEDLLMTYPRAHILMTTGTVTSAALMQTRLPDRSFHQYIPVDHPKWVERFLNHWRPDMVVWSESELWPNMLMNVQARKIPAVLLNARMSEKTYTRWRYMKRFMRDLLKTFHVYLAQNKMEATRLENLGAENVYVSGNLKYAAKPLPYDPNALDALKARMGDRPTILWASTHQGEEKMAADVHQALKDTHSNLLTVIVPRHPARGQDIEQEISSVTKNLARRSDGAQITAETDIYIADTLGELGLFYRVCSNVVMGGSFARIGGHNPIEPAVCGCAIFFGPMFYNFKTIMAEFREAEAVIDVVDEQDLKVKLATALQNPRSVKAVGENAQKLTIAKANVVKEIMGYMIPLVDQAKQKKGGMT